MWAVAQKHPEVVKVLLAHGADVQARSDVWNEVMAVPPHGYLEYNRAIPHGGETALMFAARVGDLDSAKLLVAAGANVNDADAWGVSATSPGGALGLWRAGRISAGQRRATRTWRPAGFTALHDAIMRRDEKTVKALLDAWRGSERAAEDVDSDAPLDSHDFYFDPSLVGATPFWLAARFSEPGVMRLLVKHGADPIVCPPFRLCTNCALNAGAKRPRR